MKRFVEGMDRGQSAIFSLPWRCSRGALGAITVRTGGRSNSHDTKALRTRA